MTPCETATHRQKPAASPRAVNFQARHADGVSVGGNSLELINDGQLLHVLGASVLRAATCSSIYHMQLPTAGGLSQWSQHDMTPISCADSMSIVSTWHCQEQSINAHKQICWVLAASEQRQPTTQQ